VNSDSQTSNATPLDDRILDARQQLVSLTQELIRIPSVNPPGLDYAAVCDVIDRFLSAWGFEVTRVRACGALGDSDRYPRWNIIARHEGRHTGECVHFNSHTDVVTAGKGWTVDPFTAEVIDGRVYGRGACDMKGGLAASMIAAVCFVSAVLNAFESQLYPDLAKRRTDMPVVPEGARQSTLNINSMHGGLDEPESDYTGLPSALVPDSCRMVIDRRFLVEESLDEVKAEVHAVLDEVQRRRPGFQCDVRELFSVLPTMTDQQAPIVVAVADAIRQQFSGEPDYVVSPGTYDQKHIDRIGRLHNCIAYGPGILDLAHQPDEYIDIQDMIESAQVMGRTLQSLLL